MGDEQRYEGKVSEKPSHLLVKWVEATFKLQEALLYTFMVIKWWKGSKGRRGQEKNRRVLFGARELYIIGGDGLL